jgi:hypothetical protein
MSDRILLAVFEDETDLISAVKAVRSKGMRIVDAYTPYAIHGLDEAMGLRSSRLTWVCFACGMFGALGMLWFQHWTAAQNWSLDVGGKPWNSLPSDVPVAFEAAVLLAGFGSVLALLAVSRLFPGKSPHLWEPRVTDDQFLLVIDQSDASFDVEATKRLLSKYHAIDTQEGLTPAGAIG